MVFVNQQSYTVEGADSANTVDTNGRYKTLFEQVNAAVFLSTLQGEILEVNLKASELFGYKPDEMKNISLKDLFPPSLHWEHLIEEIMAKGGFTFENEAVRKNRSMFPVEISTSLFTLHNQPVMLALIQDITDRKKAEQKLKEKEQKYQGLFECTSDGMMVLDARGEICDVNTKALELLGLEKEEVINNNIFNLNILPTSVIMILLQQFERLLINHHGGHDETQLVDVHGNKHIVELSSFFLYRKDNEIDYFVIVIRERKNLNQNNRKLVQIQWILETLLDTIPYSIYFKDENNRFIIANRMLAAQYQVSPEEIPGKTEFDFLPNDEAEELAGEDAQILQTGTSIVNKIKNIRAHNTVYKTRVTKIPQIDTSGNVTGLICISELLTEELNLSSISSGKRENQFDTNNTD